MNRYLYQCTGICFGFLIALLTLIVPGAGASAPERPICDVMTLDHFASATDSFESETLTREPADFIIVNTPTDGGIREDVPDRYRERFERWKSELLSTDFGRRQWNEFAENRNFVLTVKVTSGRGKGAGTDDFQWNEKGSLVGATITLGDEIDEGYPTPVYYPVLNSLGTSSSVNSINGRILAATKISHEIGHVSQTAKANMKLVQLQNRLMPVYVSIFLKNGLNTADKRLVDLASQMGGTPVEIWESREYWSEVTAMLFLKERIGKEESFCPVFNKIKRNLITYAPQFEPRFEQFPDIAHSPCWK
jgi:hypothetical protein